MTSSRHKLRAALLAVIMVTSVMAIGGLGSAEISSSDITLSDSEPTPGSDVTVTVTATPDNGTEGFQLNNEHIPSAGSIVNSDGDVIEFVPTVQVNGAEAQTSQNVANQNGVQVIIPSSQFDAGDQITIEYTIATEDAAGKTVNITGSVTNGPTQDLPDRSYTVTDSGPPPAPSPNPRADWNPSFDDGEGPGTTGTVSDGAIIFQGEDNLGFSGPNAPTSSSQLSRAGGANEGTPLDRPVAQDAPTGTYDLNGGGTGDGGFAVTVQTPRVSTLDVNNNNGEDVNGGTLVADQTNASVEIEYNYGASEDIELTVEDSSGTEVTNEILDDSEPDAVENVDPDSTATIAIDPSQVDEGEYTFTATGIEDLDFGDATRSTTVTIASDRNAELSLGNDEATQGENVGFTIDNSPEGSFHAVVVESSDFRDNIDADNADNIFREVGDTEDSGIVSPGGDVLEIGTDIGATDAVDSDNVAYAFAIVEIDGGNGVGGIETQFIDDTSVTVDLYTSSSTAQTPYLDSNNNHIDANLVELESNGNIQTDDDQDLDVLEGEVSLENPDNTYIVNSEIELNGTTAPGVDEVAIYARDQGDYELVQIDGSDTVTVDADNTFSEDDVSLTDGDGPGNDLLSIPGSYRIGVIDASDAGGVGNINSVLDTSGFNGGVSSSKSIRVTDTELSGDFTFYNGQIAEEDRFNAVDVEGLAPGQSEVGVIFVGPRGNTETELVSVDSDDTFDEEDLSLGGQIAQGTVSAHFLSDGRDGEIGATGTDLEDFVNNDIPSFEDTAGGSATGEQVREQIIADSVDDTASDDLFITETFRLADGLTTIEEVNTPVSNNGTIEVTGQTNRKPDDTTIVLELLDQEDNVITTASTDTWDTDGTYTASLSLDAVETGNYTLEADDSENTDRVPVQVVEQVTEETPTPEPTTTEEPTPTATPEPATEEPTPTATPEPATEEPTSTPTGTPGFGIVVALIALIAAALLAVRRNN
uniref:Major cell surface glycoprotein n=1 Tax=uncultured haloarchaeon TaxID=160804 RepID=A0A0K1YAW7_9EURY|nr:major cell surface glycoprotein [uncultured haloarchaeon]